MDFQSFSVLQEMDIFEMLSPVTLPGFSTAELMKDKDKLRNNSRIKETKEIWSLKSTDVPSLHPKSRNR